MFTPTFTPKGEFYIMFTRMEGRSEDLHSYIGDNFNLGDKVHPWGQSSPLANF
jgi:hypothetical protein